MNFGNSRKKILSFIFWNFIEILQAYRWLPFLDHDIYEQCAVMFERTKNSEDGTSLAEVISRLGISTTFVRKILVTIAKGQNKLLD